MLDKELQKHCLFCGEMMISSIFISLLDDPTEIEQWKIN